MKSARMCAGCVVVVRGVGGGVAWWHGGGSVVWCLWC
jgi:hypothetical protein